MSEFIPAEFEVIDDRFAGVGGDFRLERVFDRGRWLEGPAYHPAGRFLLFSDIPNDRVLRWDEVTGRVDEFRRPAGFTNGRTVDRQGCFITCEQGERRVTRTEHDGSVTVLADNYQGRRLNSPNDVVERADGSIWFTDPTYGINNDYEGHAAESEQDGRYVFRIDPSGALTVVADDFDQPNGLAFSADQKRLFVVDSGRGHLRAFAVTQDQLVGGEVFATCHAGIFDGIRLDHQGRVWAAAQDGLHCLAPDGTLIGKLKVPETVSNFCFGGRQRNHLFITASTSLYTMRVNFSGVVYP